MSDHNSNPWGHHDRSTPPPQKPYGRDDPSPRPQPQGPIPQPYSAPQRPPAAPNPMPLYQPMPQPTRSPQHPAPQYPDYPAPPPPIPQASSYPTPPSYPDPPSAAPGPTVGPPPPPVAPPAGPDASIKPSVKLLITAIIFPIVVVVGFSVVSEKLNVTATLALATFSTLVVLPVILYVLRSKVSSVGADLVYTNWLGSKEVIPVADVDEAVIMEVSSPGSTADKRLILRRRSTSPFMIRASLWKLDQVATLLAGSGIRTTTMSQPMTIKQAVQAFPGAPFSWMDRHPIWVGVITFVGVFVVIGIVVLIATM